MTIVNFFSQLSKTTGLPLIVSTCALVIIFAICTFGILILFRVRSIKKVLNNLDDRLDIIGHQLGWQSGEFENIQVDKDNLGSHENDEIDPGGHSSLQTSHPADIAQQNGSEEQGINPKISAKIHELLKKSGKPTPYHELTEKLSRDYPGYNYDFFLKEVEDLQKEGKVEVQLIAGKLYFQIGKKG